MANSSEKFYDRFALFYPVVELFLSSQKRKFFNEINRHPHGRLLEIGVGNGSSLKYYNTHEITGVDTSRNMLAEAEKVRKTNVRLFQMDGEKLSFPEATFDYVVLSHVIAVVENPERLLEEVYRVLTPDGKVFILNHFTPNNALKYVDKVFGRISRLFHFKSEFKPSHLQTLQRFQLRREFSAGLLSYFKVLVYEKGR